MGKKRTLLVIGILLATLIAVAATVRDAAVGVGLRGIVAAFGYRLDARHIRLTPSSLELLAPVVRTRTGEPVLNAVRLDVGFSLRDLLPGSHHRFGLTAVDLERPRLTLIHHPDGTYNVTLPAAGPTPARPDTTPLDIRLRVRNGVVVLVDRFVVPNQERRESLRGLSVDAVLSPHDPAYYRVDATLHDGKGRYPISGRGRFDHARLFAAQRWRAGALPIGPLIDFGLTTHQLSLVGGTLRDIDVRGYGFIRPDGTTDAHLGGSAQLVDGKLFVAKLGAAVGDAHGPLRVYEDGLTTTGIDATLAQVPLHLVGSAYGLSQPQVRFVLTGTGPLERLRTLAPQIAGKPIGGTLAFALRADGPLARPLVRGRFRAPRVTYGAYALRDLTGEIAVSGEELRIVGLAARYGAIALRGGGTVILNDHLSTDLAAAFDGPARALPYVDAIVPGASLRGLAVLGGADGKLVAHGTVTADGSAASLNAPFALDADGTGSIGPIALTRTDGASLYARVAFDRPNDAVDAIVSAHHLSLRRSTARLPNFGGFAPPAVSGTLDADLVGSLRGAQVASAAGGLHLRRAGIAGIPLGNADAQLGGRDAITLDRLHVHGPLGELRGEGAYDHGVLAAQGRFRGSFERLAPLLRGIPARGGIDAQVRLVANERGTFAQLVDARFARASIRGVPVRSATATIALRGRALDVQAARFQVAGGTIVAQGSFGNGGTLRLTTSDLAAAALRDAGVPLSAGRIVTIANVGGTPSAPRVQSDAVLTGGRLRGVPLDALLTARYDRGGLRLDDARAAYASATAYANGSVTGLGHDVRAARVTIAATVRGADLATLARELALPLRYPDGALDADLRVAGSLGAPALAGSARIAAGSINGLGFRDVVVPLQGTVSGVDVRGGRATVGSTVLGFDAAATRGAARVALHANRVDLADFNDYFDAADTLAGQGRLNGTLALGRDTLTTSGAIALRDARFRRMPLGDLAARWSSHGRTIAASAHLGGAHGRVDAAGSALVPAGAPLTRLTSSTLDLRANVAAFDLTTWLPALGIRAPVTGLVDGSAQIHGRVSDVAVSANAALREGIVGRVPVRMLSLAAALDRGRVRVTAARLEALNLVASGGGTFGLGATSPLDLMLQAKTPDVGALARGATGKPFDAAGALDARLHVTGTRNAPALDLLADLDQPRYGRTHARHAHAAVAFGAGRLAARDLSLDLDVGRIALNATLPIAATPPFLAGPSTPIAARLLAQQVDLGQFSSLLPAGTALGGAVTADVTVGGTLRDPRLGGTASLARGSYASPLLASAIRNAALQLAFAGHTANLRALHANLGGGAIDGSGAASVSDVRAAVSTLAFHVDTRERHIGLDVPRLFRGKIDGTLALRRDPGANVLIAGDLGFSHTRIPLSALLPSANAKQPTSAALPLAFALHVAATNDDRVQSPNVDVGVKGDATVGGTLAQPTLAGAFTSTDGTLNLYRSFTLQRARVAFDPSAGIVPDVDATATTHVPDPSTDVLLHVHGPATKLALDLSSRPQYDKAQILGLLVNAQALGAVSGVAQTSPNAGGGPNALQGAALGYVDQQFTRGLFEPFSSSVGRTLGLSSFNVNAGLTGGFSASAIRSLGERLSIAFAQSSDPQIGQRQSTALAYNLSDAAAFQLTLFDAGTGPRTVGVQAPLAPSGPTNFELQSLAPPPGSSGYVFSFVRKFP